MPTNLSASETYRSKYGDAPKLNTTNYHAWSTALMYILRAAQAWRIVIDISRILTYREQLAHTTQSLSDNEVVSHLITNLPKSWHFIRTIISNQPAAVKTLDY